MNATAIALVCCCLSGLPGLRGGSGEGAAVRFGTPRHVWPVLGEECLMNAGKAAGGAGNVQLVLREEYVYPTPMAHAIGRAGNVQPVLREEYAFPTPMMHAAGEAGNVPPVFADGEKADAPVIKIIFVEESRPEEPASDTLFYHQRHIKPGDFLGISSSSGRSEAVSYTSFAFDGSTRRYRDTLEIRLVLQVFWVKSASWARTMPPNRHTLEHEQLHFDITRLVAERFRQKVLSMPLTFDDHDSRIQYEYLEAFREMNRMQDDFDNAVNRGMDAAGQREWLRRIRGELHGFGVVTPEM